MESKPTLGFSAQVIEHFLHPRNVGIIDSPEGMSTITNPVCGDTTELFLRIKNGIVEDARFHSLGCVVTIASASVFTEKIKGCRLAELFGRAEHEIVPYLVGIVESELGELPVQKLHCPPATVQAFLEAVGKHAQAGGNVELGLAVQKLLPRVSEYYRRGVKAEVDR